MKKELSKKIPKTKERRYQDFYDFCCILEDSICSYEKCKNIRHQDAYIKVMLFALRSLFDKKSGLLDEICKAHNLEPTVLFKGMKDLPITNPLRKDKTETLFEYLDNKQITLNAKEFSIREFIWKFACNDASHSDPNLQKEIAIGEQFIIFGQNANKLQVVSIAKTILSVCIFILEAMEKKYPQS